MRTNTSTLTVSLFLYLFHKLFPSSALISLTDGAARTFLPPYAAAWFEPDWDLWSILYRLSYSAVGNLLLVSVRSLGTFLKGRVLHRTFSDWIFLLCHPKCLPEIGSIRSRSQTRIGRRRRRSIRPAWRSATSNCWRCRRWPKWDKTWTVSSSRALKAKAVPAAAGIQTHNHLIALPLYHSRCLRQKLLVIKQ